MAGIIKLGNFNLGGLSDSKDQGKENSLYRLTNFDLYSEPGVLKCNQALIKDSGTTIDDFVKVMINCTDGNVYAFGSTNGKIWKRTSGGTWSLEATDSQGGILNAIEDQGKIYYFTETKVGRWVVGTAWSTRNDNWDTLTDFNATLHPVAKVNLIVYFGNGNYVGQIEDDVLTEDALDIKTGYQITALGVYDVSLLIGATYSNASATINQTEIFSWDTYSISFSSSDPIPEPSINCFLDTDNAVLVSCGHKGNIYSYNGGILQPYVRIPGSYPLGYTNKVHSEAKGNIGGINYFGVSNLANNPSLCGIYSFGRYTASHPMVMALDYTLSVAKTASVEVGAIANIGDLLLVSWKDGTTYGVDKIDSANKATATLESRLIKFDRAIRTNVKEININYNSLPTGTSFNLYVSKNLEAYGSAVTLTTSANTKQKSCRLSIAGVHTLQLKVEVVPSVNLTPELESIDVLYDE